MKTSINIVGGAGAYSTPIYVEEPIKKQTNYMNYTIQDDVKNHCVTMIDAVTNKQISQNGLHCFWCKHPFKHSPIGCPLKYIPNFIKKSFQSYSGPDSYIIKEPVFTDPTENKNEHVYIVDGCFCSFECDLAWIMENTHNPLYKHSKQLLYQYQLETTGKKTKIQQAPHWRLLKIYGGFLSIDELRKSFNNVIYKHIDNYVVNVPKSRTVGMLYEEQCIF